MTSRFSIPTILLAAMAFAAEASRPGTASAGSIASFRIENDTGGPISRADFEILPAGSVKPPVIGSDPTTGLPQTASPLTLYAADSDGFDPANFHVALGSNSTIEGLRLLFGQTQVVGAGGQVSFQPVSGSDGAPPRFWDNGGDVAFSLALDPTFQGKVTLESINPKIHVYTYTPTPEPVSLALWTVVGVGGMIGARRRAKAKAKRPA